MADWTKALSGAILPVVLISACSLLALAFYNRLTAVVARIRAFQRECLSELDKMQIHGGEQGLLDHMHRLMQLQEAQTDEVLCRARLLRWALSCLLIAIALLLLSSIGLGLSAILSSRLLIPAVICFFAAAVSILAAVIFAISELRAALTPIEEESEFVRHAVNKAAAG
jgi:hypothetical protein